MTPDLLNRSQLIANTFQNTKLLLAGCVAFHLVNVVVWMGVRKATVVSCSIKKKLNCFLLSVRGLLCWWQHLLPLLCESTSNVYCRNTQSHLMTESGRKSATTILCYRAATIKQSTSHERKSVICLFCLDCHFSDRVTGRVLEPVPAAKRRRQGTALDKSESPIWVFGGFGTLLKVPGTCRVSY